MTKKDFLQKKRQEIVKKNLFKLKTEYKRQDNTVHCFYEGKDNIFYRAYIENEYYNYKYYFYVGNGKDTVFDAYEKIFDAENYTYAYHLNRILFFTDKDVDNYISKTPRYVKENIFETEYYSIENYIVNKDVFYRILTETFDLSDDIDIKYFLQLFEDNQKEFHEKSRFISAWIIYNRKMRYNSPLSDVKLDDIFTFDYSNKKIELKLKDEYADNNTKISDYLKLKTKLSAETVINFNDVNQIKVDLKNEEDAQKYTRGKFELWFFIEFYNVFVRKLIASYNKEIKEKKLEKSRMRDDTQISNNEKGIERFVSKLKIPKELKLFLQSNYQKLN